jgi:hypothetical protein
LRYNRQLLRVLQGRQFEGLGIAHVKMGMAAMPALGHQQDAGSDAKRIG